MPGAAQPAREVYRGTTSVEGKQVPLPAGEWYLAGRTTIRVDVSHDVASVALVRLRGMAVDAAVLIQTNRPDGEAGWSQPTACRRTDIYFSQVRYASDHDGACAYAAYVDSAAGREPVDPAWQQAQRYGRDVGWRFPPHWLQAAYRISDPHDAIHVRYLFAAPARAQRAAAGSLVSWTEASWQKVGDGFRKRLNAVDGLPDWSLADAASPKLPPMKVEAPGSMEQLGARMITYRAVGTLLAFGVNYLWLGDLPTAGALALAGAAASGTLYLAQDLVWSRFENPVVVVGDLPGVGTEGPGPRES